MRPIFLALFLYFVVAPELLHACIIRSIVNRSTDTDIVFQKGTFVVEGSKQPHIVPHRASDDDDFVVIKDLQISVGEYLIIQTKKDVNGGVMCKQYRLVVDPQNKKVVLQQRSVCKDKGSDRSVDYEYSFASNPESCCIDLQLLHESTGQEDELQLKIRGCNEVAVVKRNNQ